MALFLEIPRDADDDTIKKAYRQQALKWHPDKNQERLTEAENRFKEITNAFEVLSDGHERQWYDNHREAILSSGNVHQVGDSSTDVATFDGFSLEEIYTYFSMGCFNGYHSGPKGFYSVYRHVFERIEQNEKDFHEQQGGRDPGVFPLFGTEDSSSEEVSKFYSFWINFTTTMDFAFADKYNPSSAPNRRTRRAMDDENQKSRKSVKKEYVEAVRQLAMFVKKRDIRVLKMQKEEEERKAAIRAREEEKRRAKEEERRKQAAAYCDAEWITAHEESDEGTEEEFDDKEEEALWCVVCDKVFKSEKAMQNHENSKKHKQKMTELEKALNDDAAGTQPEPKPPHPPPPIANDDKQQEAHTPEEEELPTESHEERRVTADISDEESSDVDDQELASRFADFGVHKQTRRRKSADEMPNSSEEEEDASERHDAPQEPDNDGRSTKVKRSKTKRKKNDRSSQSAAALLTCSTCGVAFPSRNLLFKHIHQTNHAHVKPG